MAKIIQRNVPIAEENETLTGQPATNMFNDWSEDMTERADNPFHGEGDQPKNEEDRERRLREMDKIVENDIKKAKS